MVILQEPYTLTKRVMKTLWVLPISFQMIVTMMMP